MQRSGIQSGLAGLAFAVRSASRESELERAMRLLAVIGALAIVVVIGAAVFFFGGYYSVAATKEIAPVAWVVVHVRQASVDRHATEGPPMSLDDAAVVRAGAHAFDT